MHEGHEGHEEHKDDGRGLGGKDWPQPLKGTPRAAARPRLFPAFLALSAFLRVTSCPSWIQKAFHRRSSAVSNVPSALGGGVDVDDTAGAAGLEAGQEDLRDVARGPGVLDGRLDALADAVPEML